MAEMNDVKKPKKLAGIKLSLFSLVAAVLVATLLLSSFILNYVTGSEGQALTETLQESSMMAYVFIFLLILLPILLLVLYLLNTSQKLFRSPNDIYLQRWSKGLFVIALLYCYLEAELWYNFVHMGSPDNVTVFIAHLVLLPLLAICMLVVNSRRAHTVESLQKRIRIQSSIIARKNAEERRRKEEEERKKREQAEVPRFGMLSAIDLHPHRAAAGVDDEKTDLKTLCEEFRAFSANKLGLYYDISDIRRFIAGLAVSRILILQGMSGTGKTSLAYAFGEFLENPSTIIPVQPMWKERTDLLGYYNEFTKRFNETLLLQKMYEANYNREMYITILDELNIARVEYYFAEFLSLLEIPDPEARMLEVVSDEWKTDPKLLKEGRLKLPENMWFIGTANNDDSTFAISDKVYDRAMVLNLDRKSEPFTAPGGRTLRVSAEQFASLAAEAQAGYEITGRNLRRIGSLDAYLVEKFHVTFGNRIMKQIRNYVPVYVECGGTELEALDDIIAKKVLRKLEVQNAAYLKNMCEELCNFLDGLFGVDRMPCCKEAVRRMARNA